MHHAARALGVVIPLTAISILAVPAPAGAGTGSGQNIVNPSRCAAQGGTYSTNADGTTRSCSTTTSATPARAIQLLGAPAGIGPFTAAYFHVSRVAITTTSTTGNTTTTAGPTYSITAINPNYPITCAYGNIIEILNYGATTIDCTGLGIPDLSTASTNPVLVEQ